ncbi:MAG: DNA-directed RNA polymerase subunit alpha C-terminal domain-containing protein [Planctomycetota bacterium]|jgi:DNA-directed RNA polymerase alpha subunit
MDKKQADKIRDILGEIRFCETKLQQLRVELVALTGVDGKLTPVSVLGLSTRSQNALARAGYRGVEQLLMIKDWRDLLYSCNNFGEKSLREVKQKLAEWQSRSQNSP